MPTNDMQTSAARECPEQTRTENQSPLTQLNFFLAGVIVGLSAIQSTVKTSIVEQVFLEGLKSESIKAEEDLAREEDVAREEAPIPEGLAPDNECAAKPESISADEDVAREEAPISEGLGALQRLQTNFC